METRMWGQPSSAVRRAQLDSRCLSQVALIIFVATNTPKIVAVLRTLPEIVMSASDTGGYFPASITGRSLTSCSCSTSQDGFKGHARHRLELRRRERSSPSC